MALLLRMDEQIKVGTTVGLTAGLNTFTFDGTSGKPYYKGYEIVISEISGRGILVKGLDYDYDYTTGTFTLLQAGDLFADAQWYNVHFQVVGQPQPPLVSFLIDSTYFIRDIVIPNTGNDSVLQRIDLFINKYEPQCLELILGYRLHKALLTESSVRMTELIYGAEYTDSIGELRKWQGLVHDEKISLIANYIYYYFQISSATQTTGISTGAMKTEAGQSVSPADKMNDAWNFFSDEVKSMSCFLWFKTNGSNIRVYPEFTSYQFTQTSKSSRKNNVFGI